MNEKKPTGKVNVFRVLAGGYLLYLSYCLARDLMKGVGNSAPLAVVGIIVFVAFGGWLLWREWKAYRFGVEHIDDPTTWSDEPEQLEEPEEEAEPEEEEESET